MRPAFERRIRRIRVRWRLLNQPLRLTVQTMTTALAGVTGFVVLQANTAIDATAASVIVAGVFGSVTVLQHRQGQRRQYTVELIAAFQMTDQLAVADAWMARRIAAGLPITAEIGEADEPFVIAMLDYYEFLAVLAEQGVVDVALIRNLRGGTMTRCFDLCRSYIDDRRDRVGTELYRGLEIFTDAARPPVPSRPPRTTIAPAANVALRGLPGTDGVATP
ncbi:hypothetical protein [Nocardia sp. NPDC024068]|uniref:DUF4760 domain-containing protein n=1 Tax=Nocardia sp. NPDC024068 TaxID=3157197 RepID=UPI0033C18C7C